MHKIITSPLTREKPFIGEDSPHTRGFLISIEPPVGLVPEIVALALRDGTLGDASRASRDVPFTQVSLVGCTEDRTVIYARLI